ncbi:MAG: hypothetical protein HC933_00275 [Pleurocapsa sp. SU_196_0]|nr:hypothetical protein [Pleurocapsa sp. SU_196_0]
MKPMQAVSWIYLGATALLCVAVATRTPMVNASSTAQDGESLGLLIWVLVSAGIGLAHDQPSMLAVPRVNPWLLVLTLLYALLVAGGVTWIGTLPTPSSATSLLERILGVSLAWGLFCTVPWALGRWAARRNDARDERTT